MAHPARVVYRIFAPGWDGPFKSKTKSEIIGLMNSNNLQPDDYADKWIISYEGRLRPSEWVAHHFKWIVPCEGRWE